MELLTLIARLGGLEAHRKQAIQRAGTRYASPSHRHIPKACYHLGIFFFGHRCRFELCLVECEVLVSSALGALKCSIRPLRLQCR